MTGARPPQLHAIGMSVAAQEDCALAPTSRFSKHLQARLQRGSLTHACAHLTSHNPESSR